MSSSYILVRFIYFVFVFWDFFFVLFFVGGVVVIKREINRYDLNSFNHLRPLELDQSIDKIWVCVYHVALHLF